MVVARFSTLLFHVVLSNNNPKPPRGKPCFTYRLVEPVRYGERVRQRTPVNLGRHFDVHREQWPALVQHIKQIITGQQEMLVVELGDEWINGAEWLSAQIIHVRARHLDEPDAKGEELQ